MKETLYNGTGKKFRVRGRCRTYRALFLERMLGWKFSYFM